MPTPMGAMSGLKSSILILNPTKATPVEACDPVCADNPDQVWHTVEWKGNADVRALWNKPVRLVFHLQQASLYAFQFVGSQ